jgi:2-C-methyl-D-erythritol 4-phosphate cytidylyltransferase
MPEYFALLPAAGVGARMGVDMPKQYLDIAGRPMLWHAIQAFERHPAIARVYVAIAPEDGYWDGYAWDACAKLRLLRQGGATRAETVLNSLRAMAGEAASDDWILVHDAARPCVSRALLDRLLAEVSNDPVGGILAQPVADTLKRADAAGRIAQTVPRAAMWGAQTPQMFHHALLLKALEHAGTEVTDEASALEALGLMPKLVASDMSNLKVTYPRDLEVAAWLLARAPELDT